MSVISNLEDCPPWRSAGGLNKATHPRIELIPDCHPWASSYRGPPSRPKMERDGLDWTTQLQRLGRWSFPTAVATFWRLGIVTNGKVLELLNKRAPKYNDRVEEEMTNPWADCVEACDHSRGAKHAALHFIVYLILSDQLLTSFYLHLRSTIGTILLYIQISLRSWRTIRIFLLSQLVYHHRAHSIVEFLFFWELYQSIFDPINNLTSKRVRSGMTDL